MSVETRCTSGRNMLFYWTFWKRRKGFIIRLEFLRSILPRTKHEASKTRNLYLPVLLRYLSISSRTGILVVVEFQRDQSLNLAANSKYSTPGPYVYNHCINLLT